MGEVGSGRGSRSDVNILYMINVENSQIILFVEKGASKVSHS